jgi:hypothetical protein
VGPSSSRSSSARRKPRRRLPTTTANSASPEATVAQPPLPRHIPECSPDRGQHVTVRVLPNYPLWDQERRRWRRRRGWVRGQTCVPAGPIPLAARGLAAVLTRADPADAPVHHYQPGPRRRSRTLSACSARFDRSCQGSDQTRVRDTSRVKDKHRRPWLPVTTGGESSVSHAGGSLLVATAHATEPFGELSRRLGRRPWRSTIRARSCGI